MEKIRPKVAGKRTADQICITCSFTLQTVCVCVPAQHAVATASMQCGLSADGFLIMLCISLHATTACCLWLPFNTRTMSPCLCWLSIDMCKASCCDALVDGCRSRAQHTGTNRRCSPPQPILQHQAVHTHQQCKSRQAILDDVYSNSVCLSTMSYACVCKHPPCVTFTSFRACVTCLLTNPCRP